MKRDYNFGLLKQKIKDDFGTYTNFAKTLGITNTRLSTMLNGKAIWPPDLIYDSAELLGIVGKIEDYFFTPKYR